MKFRRIVETPALHWVDAGIRKRFAIEEAAWITHPRVDANAIAVVRYVRSWTMKKSATFKLHVSADQRYTLCIDGERVSIGPDRSDPAHWAFTSLEVSLPAGRHKVEAEVTSFPIGVAPCAQMTLRHAFILKTEGLGLEIDTGLKGWKCALRNGLSVRERNADYEYRPFLSGQYYDFNGEEWSADLEYVEPVECYKLFSNHYGELHGRFWRLAESLLPEQVNRPFTGGKVRVVAPWDNSKPVPDETASMPTGKWDALVADGKPVKVAADTDIQVIWDLRDYYCGFPHLELAGGKGAVVSYEWAESLFLGREHVAKGGRDDVSGKFFYGQGDAFHASGRRAETFDGVWWRSGKFIRLRVKTGAEPLTIKSVAFNESRYPLKREFKAEAAPSDFAGISKLAARGIEMCTHETFMDCPYYEQLQYVGDGRIQLLTWYAMTRDNRLPRRALQLMAWSSLRNGFVDERYPSFSHQVSITYSMIFASVVKDYMLWRDDCEWLRGNILTPFRCMMENLAGLVGADGLAITPLPGWSFVDWVNGWEHGNSPSEEDGLSATLNLQFALAFRDAADIEAAIGDENLADRWGGMAARISKATAKRFWNAGKGAFAETSSGKRFTEHAQCLAALAGVAKPSQMKSAMRRMDKGEFEPTTVYFSFYNFEMWNLMNSLGMDVTKSVLKRLEFWDDLAKRGFDTPVEMPEPSRSDCHAWGSHPLFHFYATIAGIRPAAAGFRKVDIHPLPNLPYKTFNAVLPHPAGDLKVAWTKDGGRTRYAITLPKGVCGTFTWNGKSRKLGEGTVEFEA